MPRKSKIVREIEREDTVVFYDKYGIPWTRGNLEELVHAMYDLKGALDVLDYFFAEKKDGL